MYLRAGSYKATRDNKGADDLDLSRVSSLWCVFAQLSPRVLVVFRPILGRSDGILSGIMPEERSKPENSKVRRILSVPLSPEQMADLAWRAGRTPLSAFARAKLFSDNDNLTSTCFRARGTAPVRNEAALAEVLAKLGNTDMGVTFREMAQLSRYGALPLTPETETYIQQACRDIADIKTLLMNALGIRER